jgi:hypothetical protein
LTGPVRIVAIATVVSSLGWRFRRGTLGMRDKSKCSPPFAVFCKDRNLAIECDGDEHHMRRSAVERDKKRSNVLQSRGWSTLHFTTSALRNDMPGTMNVIRESIAHYGGLW